MDALASCGSLAENLELDLHDEPEHAGEIGEDLEPEECA
jgi:hypothetical protein